MKVSAIDDKNFMRERVVDGAMRGTYEMLGGHEQLHKRQVETYSLSLRALLSE